MSGAGRGSGAAIPAVSKKLVAELKLIVDFPETEIYAMLRECNMDPNEAVHRLLSQDTFHEVKSKRDKKKEVKEPTESWTRVGNSSSARGTRAGPDRVGRGIATQSSAVDHGAGRGKPLKKKEHGTGVVPTTSVMESSTIFNNTPWKSQFPNIHASAETKMHPSYDADELSPSLQPSSGVQNNWLVKPGHVSMADIVKMGRPQAKPSSLPVVASEGSFTAQNAATIPQHGAKRPPETVQEPEIDKNSYSQESISHVPEISHELGIDEGQHGSYDGWTLIDEQSSRSGPTMIDKFEVPAENVDPVHFRSSNLVADDISSHVNPHFQEIQSPEDDFDGNSLLVESRPASVSDRHIQVDVSGDASHLNEGLLSTTNSYQSPQRTFEHDEESFPAEDIGVASAATELQNLHLHEDDANRKSIEANPAVIIPDHLQVTNADCVHLSFGSFESGTFAGCFPSKPLQSKVNVVATVADSSSPIEQPDARPEYYDPDQQLTASLTGTVTSRTDDGSENLEMASASQPELARNDPLDTRYGVPSVSDYTSSSSNQPNVGAYAYPQGNVQMQNLSPFSSLMQPNALQSNLLAQSLPPLRDFDLSISTFIQAQTVPTKYNAAGSSISGSNIPLQEAVKPGGFANTQTAQQNLPSTSNSSAASALPQHLPMHHYSQAALPLSHYANMISYPFLPQSYTYLPSAAFQQAYAANNGPFHQSPASLPSAGMKYMLPQYKNNASITSLPQSATVASVYGGFGNSTITPGNYSLNHAAASPSATLGFDETLNLQYKEGNQYIQQTENPAMWGHDASSRTISAHPGSNFYNYQAQNQQTALRQSQQSSQFGNLGYPNFYHSQAAASQEHQQTPSEGNINGSQNAQAQPAHHIWQHSY